MITDGDSTELVQQFAAWYQGTQPYGASTDGRRFASFTTESNGMSLQCTSAWTDAHSTNGTRYCGPSIHLDLYSTNPRHTTALLARILDVIVSHRRGHFFIVMPASCDVHGLNIDAAGTNHGVYPDMVACRSSGRKYQCWFLL